MPAARAPPTLPRSPPMPCMRMAPFSPRSRSILISVTSSALHEQAISDHRSGRIINANLAEYHVPVNADVPSLEALMVEEHDPHVNALGIKGVGEIGVTGSAGAVANAVWHATGVRQRRFPIRIDELVMPPS